MMALPSSIFTARFYLANISPYLPKNTDVKQRKTGITDTSDEEDREGEFQPLPSFDNIVNPARNVECIS